MKIARRIILGVLGGGLVWGGISCADEVHPVGDGLMTPRDGIRLDEGRGRYATVTEVRGKAHVTLGGARQPVKAGMVLPQGTAIETDRNSSVVVFIDEKGRGGQFELKEGARLSLETLKMDPVSGDQTTDLELAVGCVMVHAEKLRGSSKFEVNTPTATTGVRGTRYQLCEVPSGALLEVVEGLVVMDHRDALEYRADMEDSRSDRAKTELEVPAGRAQFISSDGEDTRGRDLTPKEIEDKREEIQRLETAADLIQEKIEQKNPEDPPPSNSMEPTLVPKPDPEPSNLTEQNPEPTKPPSSESSSALKPDYPKWDLELEKPETGSGPALAPEVEQEPATPAAEQGPGAPEPPNGSPEDTQGL